MLPNHEKGIYTEIAGIVQSYIHNDLLVYI